MADKVLASLLGGSRDHVCDLPAFPEQESKSLV